MTSQIKPIKVYGKDGPNPPKVAMLLNELGLPHEIEVVPFSEVKNDEYLAINPNGRIPSIHDPNTGLTLWETGAIIEYLIEKYDHPQHKLSFVPGTPESYLAKQWLFYQTTGQGPYYGQAVWFRRFHPETLPSAVERYVKEINRVTSVLEGHLAKQRQEDGPGLSGDRYSFADLAFVPWQNIVATRFEKEAFDIDAYPHVKRWLNNMLAREKVKSVLGEGH